MKSTNLLIVITLVVGCHQANVDPSEEVPATVIKLELNPAVFCTCCQGYRIQIGSKQYFTNHVPAPFDQPNTPVLLRYTQPESECRQAETSDRIQIISIRAK